LHEQTSERWIVIVQIILCSSYTTLPRTSLRCNLRSTSHTKNIFATQHSQHTRRTIFATRADVKKKPACVPKTQKNRWSSQHDTWHAVTCWKKELQYTRASPKNPLLICSNDGTMRIYNPSSDWLPLLPGRTYKINHGLDTLSRVAHLTVECESKTVVDIPMNRKRYKTFGMWSADWSCRNGENKVTREKSWISSERQHVIG